MSIGGTLNAGYPSHRNGQTCSSCVSSYVITDLKKRLLELERANNALTEKIQELSVPPTNSYPAVSPQLQTKQASTERLVEIIPRLENRISELEREIVKNIK
ncbi:MAG: hypothetical protein KF693_08800 [Nitrospira sp.]|nr:hypothetical protein [Nitrospira sp.]